MTMKWRWQSDGILVLNGSVVGTINVGASGTYYAYGCLDDWQDVNLGMHHTEEAARNAVEQWVSDKEVA